MAGELGGVSRTYSMPHTTPPADNTSGNNSTPAKTRSDLTPTSAALAGLSARTPSFAAGRGGEASTSAPRRNDILGDSQGARKSNASIPSDAASYGSTSLRRHYEQPVFTASSPFHDVAIEIDRNLPPPPPGSSWRAIAAAPLSGLASFSGSALTSIKNKAGQAKEKLGAAASYTGEKLAVGMEKGKELAKAGYALGETGVKFGGRQIGKVGSSAVSGLGAMGLKPKFLGAVAGHTIHQAVAVGGPTFLREIMFEALFAALRQLPHEHVVALQVVSGTVSLGLHRLRQYREQRNPEAAARGFHNLSAEQWAALPPDEREKKMEEQRKYSDAVTTLATGAILTNISLGVAGPHIGKPELAAQLMATDTKVLAYAAMRDTIQASFSMVDTETPTNGGVSGAHMDASANFYAQANIVTNYAFDAFVPQALGDARLALAGEKSPLDKHQAMDVVLHSSAVKATLNTLLETADWTNVTQEEAKEAGTEQKWSPSLGGGTRDKHMRVFDQSVARTAAINSNIAASNLLSVIGKQMKLPEAATTLLSNGGSGIMAGLSYKVIGGTWQAESAVRKEMDKSPSPTEDTGSGG
ncbi:MAG TPA: hypothetical protein VF472_04385 [Burkholderiaceae bacterium]